jgi:ribonuclease P protein subunit RPR2
MVNYKAIATERIEILMTKALDIFHEDKARANRYVDIARRIATRNAMPFPKKWKRSFCKECGSLLVPGANCRVRTLRGHIVITCLECMHVTKIPFTKEIKARRRGKVNIK